MQLVVGVYVEKVSIGLGPYRHRMGSNGRHLCRNRECLLLRLVGMITFAGVSGGVGRMTHR